MWIQKGFQYAVCFIALYRTLGKILDGKGFSGAVLMDLSKVFDTIKRKLLTLFRMGFFGAAHGWAGAKKVPLPP